MSGLETNPFTLLTLIAAPAILTNASSVMGLGTSNRFARAVDRIRALSSEIQGDQDLRDHIRLMRIRQLHYAQRRSLLLVRALSAFYVSVGSFAGARFRASRRKISSVTFASGTNDWPQQ